MARQVLARGRNPANPVLFGEDLAPLAVEAGGLSLTAWVNDKLLAPVYGKLVAVQGEVLAKTADALGTGLSAYLTGEAVAVLFGSRYGRLVRRGGMILGVGKGISIVLPGFSISGSLPTGFNIPGLSIGNPPAKPALTNGNGASANGNLPVAIQQYSLSRIGGDMGL